MRSGWGKLFSPRICGPNSIPRSRPAGFCNCAHQDAFMKHQNETTRVDHPEHPLNKRLKALEQAFDRRGLIPENYFAEFHKRATEEWKPENGAKVVARAWTDPKFRQRQIGRAHV